MFPTGVTVVTTKSQDRLEGMTVNSFTSVSRASPMILVCLTLGSRTTLVVQSRGWFVVNVLREGQAALSNHFARPCEDHYNGGFRSERQRPSGVARCSAHLVCKVERAPWRRRPPRFPVPWLRTRSLAKPLP